jgi:hypothetical protein
VPVVVFVIPVADGTGKDVIPNGGSVIEHSQNEIGGAVTLGCALLCREQFAFS